MLGPKTGKRTRQLLEAGLDERFCTTRMSTFQGESTVRFNQDFDLVHSREGWWKHEKALFISVLMLFLLVPVNVEAQSAPIGVEVDYDSRQST